GSTVMPRTVVPANVEPLRRISRTPLGRGRALRNVVAVVGGVATLGFAAVEARARRVSAEEEEAFRRLNDLSDRIHLPVWAVRQSGSFASVGIVSLAALAVHHRRTALGLAAAGSGAWAGAKVVKRQTGRGRPAAHVDDVRIRGRAQTGLGFPSGHSAV